MKGYLIAAMLILTFSVLTFAADDTLPFKITTKRTDDRVRVKSQNNKVVFNIRNPTGISNATAERTTEQWPEKVVVQLRLKGGYFEMQLPKKFFEGNPESFKLEWIDFYRN